MIAFVGWWLTRTQQEIDSKATKQRQKTEQRIADDRWQIANYSAYVEAISELLLKQDLGTSPTGAEVRKIARARTLMILNTLNDLDKSRKRHILQFLYEAGLITNGIGGSIVDLRGADLSEANFFDMNLSRANLNGVFLYESDLSKANLSETNLREAILDCVDLREANLSGADLTRAVLNRVDLRQACYTDEQLAQPLEKKDVILRDGSELP